MAALEDLTEEDIAGRKILRTDFEAGYFEPTVADQLDVYREALLIFYGKVSIYLRAIDRPLPPRWQHWIG
jgi:hypothetical protein